MKDQKNQMTSQERALWQDVADTLNQRANERNEEPSFDAESAKEWSKGKPQAKVNVAEQNYKNATSFADKDPQKLQEEFQKHTKQFLKSKIASTEEEAKIMATVKMVRPELKNSEAIKNFIDNNVEALNKAGTFDKLIYNVSTYASSASDLIKAGLNKLTGSQEKAFGLHLDALKNDFDHMAKLQEKTLGPQINKHLSSRLDSMMERDNHTVQASNTKNKL